MRLSRLYKQTHEGIAGVSLVPVQIIERKKNTIVPFVRLHDRCTIRVNQMETCVYGYVRTFEVWSALYPGLMQPVEDVIDTLLHCQDVDLFECS